MDILEEARKDAKMIVNEGGFELPAIFNDGVNPDINATALFIRRTDALEFDDGSKKNSPFSSCTADYDIFGFVDKYISLKGWTVIVEGNTYEILESLPNRTLGIIQCNLKDG